MEFYFTLISVGHFYFETIIFSSYVQQVQLRVDLAQLQLEISIKCVDVKAISIFKPIPSKCIYVFNHF